MNKFKWLYCGQGNYLFEVLTILITYGVFRTLVKVYQWEWFTNLEMVIFVLSIAIGRIVFIILNYILHNKICDEKYTLTDKMMSLGTSLVLIFIFLIFLNITYKHYNYIQEKTNNIQEDQVKLYIYKGKKPNGNRRLKYNITINKILHIQDLKKNITSNINLSQNSIDEFLFYIKKLNSLKSIKNESYFYPYDLNIDIRTSENLIVFPLSGLKFVYKDEDEQKIIKDFLEFVKSESNNSIDLSHEFSKSNQRYSSTH